MAFLFDLLRTKKMSGVCVWHAYCRDEKVKCCHYPPWFAFWFQIHCHYTDSRRCLYSYMYLLSSSSDIHDNTWHSAYTTLYLIVCFSTFFFLLVIQLFGMLLPNVSWRAYRSGMGYLLERTPSRKRMEQT